MALTCSPTCSTGPLGSSGASAWAAAVLLGWTLLGGLDALNTIVRDATFERLGGIGYQLALFAAFALIGGLLIHMFGIGLPIALITRRYTK